MNYLQTKHRIFKRKETEYKKLLGQILNQQGHYQDDDHLNQSYIQSLM